MEVSSYRFQDDMSKTLLLRARSISLAKLITIVAISLASVVGIQVAHYGREKHNVLMRYGDHFARQMQETSSNCTLQCCQVLEEEICGDESENSWISVIPFAVQILLIVILLCFSALFSGLTLGIMSLDTTGLEIVMSGDDLEAAARAKVIYPVRHDGNLLLCTLLLGNVLVNALLSILMAEYTGGVIGLFASTLMIVVFGEILPQAIVRNYLWMGG